MRQPYKCICSNLQFQAFASENSSQFKVLGQIGSVKLGQNCLYYLMKCPRNAGGSVVLVLG